MVSDRELEKVYKAVANRRRIAILRYLKSGSATVGEVAKAIKLSLKSTSHHLQLLSSTGFVVSEQHGLYMHYTLNLKSDSFRIVRSEIL
ncbi:MAG: metalloregulator ArsR/SmtB family transcription factor [Patescibacteria group bacterium]